MKTDGNHRQKELRHDVIAFVGKEAIASFVGANQCRVLWQIIHIWLSVIVLMLLVYMLYQQAEFMLLAVTVPLVMLFVATRINALNVLLHEAAHYCLFRGKRKNDFCANWLIGYWILFDINSYRKVHLKHHRFLNLADDPDLPLYDKASKRDILVGVMKDLALVTFFQRAKVYIEQGIEQKKTRFLYSSLMKVLCQLLLLTSFVMGFGSPQGVVFYILLWLYPLMALYPVIIRWKTLVEHHHGEFEEGNIFVARTSEIGWLESYLIGAEMQYHFEHHLFPEMSYARLKQLHQRLRENGYFEKWEGDKRETALSGGYIHFLRKHWRQCE